MATFLDSAPVGPVVFYRTYSRRKEDNTRESWLEVSDRTVSAIGAIGDLTKQEMDLIKEVQDNLHGTVSGRFLWIGGTEWHKLPENYSGAFNCTSLVFDSLNTFGKTMDLTMMGCGVGVVLEPKDISKLPYVKNYLNVEIKGNFGDVPPSRRTESTNYFLNAKENIYEIVVGDSRKGWAEAYQTFIESAFIYPGYSKIVINISQVRPAGEKIAGFGGISEPTKFAQMFPKLAKILNGALGRQLNSVEICLLVDEAALVVVAGNVRRCLPEDALVFTNKGLVPIRDIQVGDLVETPIGLRPVTNKFNQGLQDVYTLNVHSDIPLDGNYPRATLNHRIATRVGDSVKWVAISELVEGDKLVYLDTSSPKPYLPFNPIFTGLGDCKYMQTYDIEVDEVHCFYADGFLTHNSAGMRQFDKDDQLAMVAKENLWRQDETGHWSIDPDRDALRMANHTRVYHQKPTLEECINAVRKQYYSGEGAIQWAGEAVARSNADLINGESEKHNFIKAYQSGLGREWLGLKAPEMDNDELNHRMERYGLNPCLTGDTWVFTEYGARQIKSIIGKQINLYVNGQLFPTTKEGFFSSGVKEVFYLKTKEGPSIRLTGNHKLLQVKSNKKGDEWTEWAEVNSLKKGDILLLHNHRRVLKDYKNSDSILPTGLNDLDAIQQGSIDSQIHFISDFFSNKGQIDISDNLPAISLFSVSNAELLVIQRILLNFGVNSVVTPEDFELTISGCNFRIFCNTFLFATPYLELKNKKANRVLGKLESDSFAVTIASIVPYGEEEVYDCQVPGVNQFDANGFVSHNCGEIIGSDFHCVSADTLLITKDGIHKIKDVVGCEIEIWNGKKWSQVKPFKTTDSSILYRVRFGDGSYLDATEYHRFFVKDSFGKSYKEVQTKDLMNASQNPKNPIHTEPFKIDYKDGLNIDPQYAYTLGLAVGDGTTDKKNSAKIRLYERKAALSVSGSKSPIRNYDYLPTFVDVTDLGFSGELLKSLKTNSEALSVIASWNRQAILHFVAGLADADGSNTQGNGIRIYISDYDRAYRVQLLLTKCGIRSSVNLCAHKGSVTNYGTRSNDLYYLQVTNCAQIPCQRLDVSKGVEPKGKGKWQTVRSVEQLPGLHETYCFNEPEHHKGVFGNTLTGNCNLAQVELNMIDPLDFDAQHKAFTAMSLSVAALLKQGFVDPLYQYSREIDPIVGVSFTGLFDYFVNAFGIEWLEWWQAGRPKKWGDIVSDVNRFTDLIFPYDLDKLALLSYEYLDQQTLSWWFIQIETLTLRRWRILCENVIKSYCLKHRLREPNRCTTVQPAGCGSRELLRIFDQGLIYADEVMSDGQGEVEGINLSVRNGISASKGIANEPIHLLKITLNNKRLLRLTPNHRLSVEGNWVRADELIKGMKLDYQIGLYQSTNEAELIPVDLTAYRKYNHAIPVGIYQKGYLINITIPEKMSASLGYFLGALFGNGCNEQKQGSSRIRFTHQSTEILNKISSISLKLFGISGCLTEDKRGDKHELSLSSNPLYDWFQINGMTKPAKSKDLDRIPQVLRCSSTESILGFFCGLIDTDGCVRESGRLSIESASEKFIRNLQQIGEAVGLCFSISHNNKGSNYQQEKSIWSLSLSRMLSNPLAVKFLNLNSFKCQSRPIPEPSREFKFNPYQIDKIEWELEPDYSFDFAVDGQDDDDSWYWQGAIKSHNSKSLLTNASPGWHTPKAVWVIRRVTVPKNDPVALACLDYGYNIVPSTDDKDDEGNLLYDIFDSHCKSWLVEIPVKVSWGDLPGLESIDINKFSALAQFDFYSLIQREWTTHNTSATIELRENEIEELATAIYENIQNDEGYISAALLARFDDFSVFPRLPFEPITKEKYDQLHSEVLLRRFPDKTFEELLAARDLQLGYTDNVQGPAGCDSDKCLL